MPPITLSYETDKTKKINVVASHTFYARTKLQKGDMEVHKVELEEVTIGEFCLLFTHKLVSLWGLEIYIPYRRKGYAKKLLQVIIATLKAQGRHYLVLYVLPGNGSAIALYEQLGFKLIPQQDSNSLYYQLDLTDIKIGNLPHYAGEKEITY